MSRYDYNFKRSFNRGDTKFDNLNLVKYGNKWPVEYDFEKISYLDLPIHIVSASDDKWAHKLDTEFLFNKIS